MVIRMRSTRSHTGNRRSHHALKGSGLSACSKCKKPVLPHKLCANCGSYKGKEVVDVLKKANKKQKKKKAAETKG
jgi:large subunit ribosomal protein L32